jgi:uncharacterized membrane protein
VARRFEKETAVRNPYGPPIERLADHHNGWEWFAHLFGVLVFVALAALIIMLLWRWLGTTSFGQPAAAPATLVTTSPSTPSTPPDDPAISQLRMRYAQGEISRDDYVRIASDLGVVVPSPPST